MPVARFGHCPGEDRHDMGQTIYIPVQNAEMNWLEATVIRRSCLPLEQVPMPEQQRVAEIVERLAWTVELAVAHECQAPEARVRDDAMAAYAERVAVAVTAGRLQRRVIRVIWRLHIPLTWIFRRVKVAASEGRKLPAYLPDQCTLAKPIPRRTDRNFGICTWRCDAAFYLRVIELSLAELGMLLLLKKSTVDAWASECPIAAAKRGKTGVPEVATAWTTGQVADYWDRLRGAATRGAPLYNFSWRTELGELARLWWLRWR